MSQFLPFNYNRSHSVGSHKRNRTRGVILSNHGWQKLIRANVLHDEQGHRLTYEKLSELSRLNERTVGRILSCEVRVDKRTLKTFFTAFGLQLDHDDYTAVEYSVEQFISYYPDSSIYRVEMNLSYQELVNLHQKLTQDLKYLSHLLNLNKSDEDVRLEVIDLN